jgi:hypothetical protein
MFRRSRVKDVNMFHWIDPRLHSNLQIWKTAKNCCRFGLRRPLPSCCGEAKDFRFSFGCPSTAVIGSGCGTIDSAFRNGTLEKTVGSYRKLGTMTPSDGFWQNSESATSFSLIGSKKSALRHAGTRGGRNVSVRVWASITAQAVRGVHGSLCQMPLPLAGNRITWPVV